MIQIEKHREILKINRNHYLRRLYFGLHLILMLFVNWSFPHSIAIRIPIAYNDFVLLWMGLIVIHLGYVILSEKHDRALLRLLESSFSPSGKYSEDDFFEKRKRFILDEESDGELDYAEDIEIKNKR